jgi:hypothetical protein
MKYEIFENKFLNTKNCSIKIKLNKNLYFQSDNDKIIILPKDNIYKINEYCSFKPTKNTKTEKMYLIETKNTKIPIFSNEFTKL